MEKITRELLKVSGIYCIENKINHKSYIGTNMVKVHLNGL